MRDCRRETIFRLWDELADFPPAEIDDASHHLIHSICAWIGADHGGWVGAVRLLEGDNADGDALCGWRAKKVVPLRELPDLARVCEQLMRRQGDTPAITTGAALARAAGKFRVHRLRDGFIDFAAFEQTPSYQIAHVRLDVLDRLWVVFPVSADVECYYVFDKFHTANWFTQEHAELAGEAVRGIKWFHRQLLCSHGLLAARTPVTVTERQVLKLLLTSMSEKQIAAELGQSRHTAHGHIKSIYRKFGVDGRVALMTVWLNTF